MGRRKATPERSKIVRAQTPAFSRRERKGPGDPKDDESRASDPTLTEDGPFDVATVTEGKPVEVVEPSRAKTQPIAAQPDPGELPAIEPPPPTIEPWPDATPTPMKPVAPGEAVRRPVQNTAGMPVVAADYGRPPDMPKTTAPPPLVLGAVENPAHMPGPREIPAGTPDDPAPAPGVVPPGDSRSFRRGDEFALIYRVGTCVISRTGRIGTRGQWRVVEYPTSAAASNWYAKECSRFVSEGFSDYRE